MAIQWTFNPFTGNFDAVQDLSGYVPYVGATADLELATHDLDFTTGNIYWSTYGADIINSNPYLQFQHMTGFWFGSGVANTDIVFYFNGTSSTGVLTWMEDEDYLRFSDDNLHLLTKGTYYRDTAIKVASADDGHLDLTADVSVDINSPIVDFAQAEAVALVCDNGATMPSTPAEHQWFCQVTTGRKILYQYANSTWTPIFGFGDITFYVDGTDGTDSIDKGTAIDADAFKTIQYAIDAIPATNSGSVTVNVASGTYNEEVEIGGKLLLYPTTDTITIQGVALADITPDISATCDSFTRGYYGNSPNYTTPAQLTDTGNFVAGAQEGKWCYIGATAGYRLIYKNTADILYLCDGTTTACTTYTITSLNTTITNSGSATRNVVTVRVGQQSVYFRNFNIVSTGSGQAIRGEFNSEYYFYYCKVTVGSGTQNITTQYCIGSYYYCSLVQDNGNATIGVNLGAVLRLWGCLLRWSDTNGYGVRNLGAFINMAEMTTFYGPSTAVTYPGIVLNNGGFATLFQNYFDVGYGVACDGVSWCGIQSEYYAGWAASVTTDIYKPLDARNAEIRILTALAAEKETMGYDASGDYLYDELFEVKRIGQTATNYTTFSTTGFMTMTGTARAWKDELGDAISIQQTGTGVTRNTDQVYVTFTTTANLSDYLYTNIQLNHDRDPSVKIEPHIHWEQTLNSFPNFLLRYRWQVNGSATVSAWTSVPCVVPISSYPGGRFHQIADTQSGLTIPTGTNLSDIIQFKIFRDTGNASGVFSAADAYTATVGVLAFDCHMSINSLGSAAEYIK